MMSLVRVDAFSSV